jgi:hypothetical protein
MAEPGQLPYPRIPPSYPGIDHCSACNAFWAIGTDSPAATGYCLRYPPVALFGSHFRQPGEGVPIAESFFPIVLAGWWCREYQAAP